MRFSHHGFRSLCCFSAALIGFLAGPPVASADQFALLIAVGKYQHEYPENRNDGFRSLPASVEVMREFHALLPKLGVVKNDNIIFMHTNQKDPVLVPDKRKIISQLQTLRPRMRREDTLLIVMIGHGISLANEGFTFCPTDAKYRLRDTRLSIDEMTKEISKEIPNPNNPNANISRVVPKTVLFIVDACQDAARGADKAGNDGKNVENFSGIPDPPHGVGMLFSCSKNQSSYLNNITKRSLFFDAFLDGIKGSADGAHGNQNGETSLMELTSCVVKVVPSLAKQLNCEQLPSFKWDENTQADFQQKYLFGRVLPPKYNKPLPLDFNRETEWTDQDFRNMDFTGKTLTTYTFKNCTFKDCRFNQTIFNGLTTFSRSHFYNCDLTDADFRKCSPSSTRRLTVIGCDCRGSLWPRDGRPKGAN